MKIQNFSTPTLPSNQLVRAQNNNPGEPSEPKDELIPNEPREQGPNAIATGAIYGGLAGAGVAVALGAMSFGVGLITGFATIPAGVAVGALAGCVVEAFRQ